MFSALIIKYLQYLQIQSTCICISIPDNNFFSIDSQVNKFKSQCNEELKKINNDNKKQKRLPIHKKKGKYLIFNNLSPKFEIKNFALKVLIDINYGKI